MVYWKLTYSKKFFGSIQEYISGSAIVITNGLKEV